MGIVCNSMGHSKGDADLSAVTFSCGRDQPPSLPLTTTREAAFTTCGATCQTKMSLFSSETGKGFLYEILQDLWSHTPRDYQIEAVAKLLDGIDVLAILPTGAGKTAILVMFILILDQIRLNPQRFPSNRRRFPVEPIAVVVYPTNCLEEEQVRDYPFRMSSPDILRTWSLGRRVQESRIDGRRHKR